jgi:hypothetical protein
VKPLANFRLRARFPSHVFEHAGLIFRSCSDLRRCEGRATCGATLTGLLVFFTEFLSSSRPESQSPLRLGCRLGSAGSSSAFPLRFSPLPLRISDCRLFFFLLPISLLIQLLQLVAFVICSCCWSNLICHRQLGLVRDRLQPVFIFPL